MSQSSQPLVSSTFPGKEVLTNSSLEILNWMIHAKFLRKEFSECKKLAESELERSNQYNEYANYILGNIYKEEGEIQKAIKYFKKCNLLHPKNIEYLKQIGRCQYLLGRYKLALEIFSQADKLAENSDWNIYHHLGVCYARTRSDDDKAIEYLKKAVSMGRCEKSFSELAKCYDTQKDFTNAISVYQTALRLYPSSTEISVALALIYMKTEDYRNAFNQLGTSLAHDPVNAEALFTFAAEIQRHGEFDVALIKYKVAVHKLPECAEMWNNIGMCFFGKRKYISAITCLKRSYYLNPLNWLTCYNLGLLHLNMEQYASAALFLSAAAKLNAQHGASFTLLGLALKQLGDDFNCRKSFQQALKLNPNDVEACLNYSQFLYLANEINESKRYYTQYQQLLNVTPHIDKELINMGNWLSDALQLSHSSHNSGQNVNEDEDSHSLDAEKIDESQFVEEQRQEPNTETGTNNTLSSNNNSTRSRINIEEDLV